MDKYLKRAKAVPQISEGRYQKYNLRENPFPSAPIVNPNSQDAKYNGKIYEPSIRQTEYESLKRNFLAVPKNDSNQLRLGYILDTSYIGRGNGKSAFLVNVESLINEDYCYGESNGNNRCFALTIVPEPGGKTKTFDNFIELFTSRIFDSQVIDDALTSLRLEAIQKHYPRFNLTDLFEDDEALKGNLGDSDWYSTKSIQYQVIQSEIERNAYLQGLPPEFPIFQSFKMFNDIPNKNTFIEYYHGLKTGRVRHEFLFSHLVSFFLAAGFNGSYIFVDDFERIPDFQSYRQRTEFAAEIRNAQYDGMTLNARIGFYTLILVLHAGVPRLVNEAWETSGLAHRAPINFKTGVPRNLVQFGKIRLEDTTLLVQKYLNSYRINDVNIDSCHPFTVPAIEKMAQLSEFNAAKILKMAYELLERAIDGSIDKIDESFVLENETLASQEQKPVSGIHDAPTKNLLDMQDNESDR